ncbi:MAG TPA: HEAT repeat domain-containing protein, partial [Thermodesulfobacteriota bacterium]|nr:HEAT repeat domain-containing protein [Thermodesulfobacteriota bacterium]
WLHSVLSTMDALLEKISSSYFLVPLIHSLGTFNGASTDSIKKFLSLVPSRAISALAPLLWTSVPSHVHSMIAETVVLLANRTFEPFEALLVSAEDERLIRMVPLLGKMQGERSAGVLLRLVKHSSDKVRKEALKAIIVRAIWAPEDLMPLMDDENESVRQIFLRYMQSRRCETVEEGLLWYLQTHGFREEEHEHLLECFRTLGKCGSAQSLGFLRQLLLGGNWFSRLRATVRRQGAALALSELGLDEARKILAEAIHSRYPGIRKAAWAFNNLPAAGGN